MVERITLKVWIEKLTLGICLTSCVPAVGTTCLIVLCNVPVVTECVDHATTTSKRGELYRPRSIIIGSVVSIFMSTVQLGKALRSAGPRCTQSWLGPIVCIKLNSTLI